MLLTQSTAPIIGWIATLLGYVMDLIFRALSSVGIENIGLCIIFFTIFVRLLLLPLMVSQQKFQKLNAVMQPEINKIQKKYRGKKDAVSMQKQNDEIKAVYEKYGTNTTAGCLQMFIQLPIMFALYQVIRKIPAYIPEVKAHYIAIVNSISGLDGFVLNRSCSSNTEPLYVTEVPRQYTFAFLMDLPVILKLPVFSPRYSLPSAALIVRLTVPISFGSSGEVLSMT